MSILIVLQLDAKKTSTNSGPGGETVEYSVPRAECSMTAPWENVGQVSSILTDALKGLRSYLFWGLLMEVWKSPAIEMSLPYDKACATVTHGPSHTVTILDSARSDFSF